MTVYGTKIKSDIAFSLNLSDETEVLHEVEISSKAPSKLKNQPPVDLIFIGHMAGRCIFIVIVNLMGVK